MVAAFTSGATSTSVAIGADRCSVCERQLKHVALLSSDVHLTRGSLRPESSDLVLVQVRVQVRVLVLVHVLVQVQLLPKSSPDD